MCYFHIGPKSKSLLSIDPAAYVAGDISKERVHYNQGTL